MTLAEVMAIRLMGPNVHFQDRPPSEAELRALRASDSYMVYSGLEEDTALGSNWNCSYIDPEELEKEPEEDRPYVAMLQGLTLKEEGSRWSKRHPERSEAVKRRILNALQKKSGRTFWVSK